MSALPQYLVFGLVQGSIFAIVALGISLVYRVTGILSLTQGGFCLLGALSMYTLQSELGWSLIPAFIVAVAVTTLVGTAIGAATFVPAMRRLPHSSMLMLTVGLLTLIEGFALILWGSRPYASQPFTSEHSLHFLGLRISQQGTWLIGIAAVICAGLWYLLARTSLGKAMQACAEDPMAARLMGINVDRIAILAYSIAAGIGAIGGIAVAPTTSFDYMTGEILSNAGIVALAIGGLGSYVGAVAGGALLGISNQVASGLVSSMFGEILMVALLLLVLLLRPNGLFSGRIRQRVDTIESVTVHHPVIALRPRNAWIGILFLVALVIAMPIIGSDALLKSLVITGILFVAVLGLDLIMGYAGQVSIGHAAFMAIGGYSAAYFVTAHGWSSLAGILAGMVVSLLCALALAAVTMRLRGIYLALATLAFGLLVDTLVIGLPDITGGPSGLTGIPPLTVFGFAFASPLAMYVLVVGVIAILLILLSGALKSNFGRGLKAMRTDQLAAAALGVNVPKQKLIVLSLGALLASLSGSLYAFNFRFLSPDMVDTRLSFIMISMLIIGGEGTLIGPLIGTALLTLLPTLIEPLAAYKTMAAGALLVFVFCYMPYGILGTALEKLTRAGMPNGRRGPMMQARMKPEASP